MTSLALPQTTQRLPRATTMLRLGTAYLTFIGLGLSSGLLGVVIPALKTTFVTSHSSFGLLLLATTLGYVPLSLISGMLLARLGLGKLLSVSSCLLSASLIGYATAPTWWLFVGCGFFQGMAAGLLGASMNSYATRFFCPRHITWLHASFGLGMTLSSPLLTIMQMEGSTWRWGYGVTALCLGCLAVWCAATRGIWQTENRGRGAGAPEPGAAPLRSTLSRPVTWLLVGLFFIYPLETVVGTWSYSLLTTGRHVSPAAAGLWVMVYWGAFTVSRILAGALVEQIGMSRLLRVSVPGLVVGSLCIWWPMTHLNLAGLAILGIALAPLFPMLMAQTPAYLGSPHTSHAVGLQAGAASLGGAILPGLAGILADHVGMESVAGYIVGLAVLFLVLYETLQHMSSLYQR